MAIKIRKLQDYDNENIKALKLSSLKEEETAFDTSYQEAKSWTEDKWTETMEQYLSPSESIFYIAEDQGALVAFAHMRFVNKEKKKHIMEFATLYVSPQYRSKGLATELLETILEDIKENHPEIVKIQNSVYETQTEALSLYEKFGFKSYGEFEKELYVDGKYYKQIAMELYL